MQPSLPREALFVERKPGLKSRLMAPWLALAAWVHAGLAKLDAPRAAKFRADLNGFINMGSITTIIATVVLGIVILLILASLAPSFITAIGDLVGALQTGTTNNTTADALLPVFGLLIALGGVFALVGFAFLAYRRRKA